MIILRYNLISKHRVEFLKYNWLLDFTGGPMVKNPPANAGNTGSLPGLEKSPRLGQLSLCTTTTGPVSSRAHALQREKPPQWEVHAPQQRVAPARHN